MTYKIISDSSADLSFLPDVAFTSVPLRIVAGEREFTDNAELNGEEMLAFVERHKGKSGSACPGVGDWREAFGEAENIFCVTITSNLSGSYNSASVAVSEHLEEHPDRNAYVFDTLSTGPESALLIEKLRLWILEGISFNEIKERATEYLRHTHLLFSLESLRNLANNGRVSPVVAKFAGLFGIRIVGKASDQGTLEVTDKARGEKGALDAIIKNMKKCGYTGGRVRIHHCRNQRAANALKEKLTSFFPAADILISVTGGLCSFYAERGGMILGFEI